MVRLYTSATYESSEMKREWVGLAAGMLLLMVVFIVDVWVAPGLLAHAAPFAMSVLVAAYLLPPHMVAGMAGLAIVLQSISAWLGHYALPDAAMSAVGLFLISWLSTAFLGRDGRSC